MPQNDNSNDATIALHAGDAPRVLGQPVAPAPVLSTTFFTHPDAVGFSASDLKADAPH
ncbi:MAG: cystathionine gamma-synthase, partial [Hyphomicrobiales bacterium]